MTVLTIRNFAQIAEAELEFGDLTVLVGAQGTGKSLALQWLKVAQDGKQIANALRDAGEHTDQPAALIDLIFGAGMAAAWRPQTQVRLNRSVIEPGSIAKRGAGHESLFFIPAHRSLLISDGWAAPFQKLTADTPVVARLFSQQLFQQFVEHPEDEPLFPAPRRLPASIGELITDSVFHGGQLRLVKERLFAKRLRLSFGRSSLPFMTWTAGQREFTPLLLGLYHLLPPRGSQRTPGIDWVVIEEPEMGLHPQAQTAFLALVLDVLSRGYRVVLSTHSPHILSAVWMLRCLADAKANWKLLCGALGLDPQVKQHARLAKSALVKVLKVHLLAFGKDGKVRSQDISSLDPSDADNAVSGWGGLTEYTSRFADAVRQAMQTRRTPA